MDVLSAAELEASGRAVRAALEGLFALYASRSGEGADARGENKPVAPVKDNNPLKTQWPEQSKLHYVFGGRAASIGFINPQRALTEIVSELLAHDAAVSAATKAALEGTVQEFAPAQLKAKLLGTGTRLFEGSRAWEAYSRYYGERSQGLADWVQQLLDKYFTEAYLRESQRIKRETGLKSG
jgi:type VI secretion system protein ImpI